MDPSNGKIEDQDWLDPIADAIQKPAHAVFNKTGRAGKVAEDFLHGKWLGHPLHAAITDVPIGAFSVAALFDMVSTFDKGKTLNKAADAAVVVGILSATAAATAGIADYYSLKEKKTRRYGALHALMNTSALALYGASYIARRTGHRGLGKFLGWAGYAVLTESAYLGGALVYEQQIGVDHAPPKDAFPEHWTAALPESELEEGQMRRVEIDGAGVLVANHRGQIFALAAACAHLGGPLEQGEMKDGCVTCPWHGSTFALEDGSVQRGPSVYPQPRLELRVYEGQIQIRSPRQVGV